MRRYNPRVSARLDWAALRAESSRGWQRQCWRLVKRFWEMWI